jgi:hypothetical protein
VGAGRPLWEKNATGPCAGGPAERNVTATGVNCARGGRAPASRAWGAVPRARVESDRRAHDGVTEDGRASVDDQGPDREPAGRHGGARSA